VWLRFMRPVCAQDGEQGFNNGMTKRQERHDLR
jgi:hypothetical protein